MMQNAAKGKGRTSSVRQMLVLLLVLMSILGTWLRCDRDHQVDTCDSKWRLLTSDVSGIVSVEEVRKERGVIVVRTVFDRTTGKPIDIYSPEFAATASDGDIVTKGAYDTYVEIHKQDETISVPGLSLEGSCTQHWRRIYANDMRVVDSILSERRRARYE